VRNASAILQPLRDVVRREDVGQRVGSRVESRDSARIFGRISRTGKPAAILALLVLFEKGSFFGQVFGWVGSLRLVATGRSASRSLLTHSESTPRELYKRAPKTTCQLRCILHRGSKVLFSTTLLSSLASCLALSTTVSLVRKATAAHTPEDP
jgi:hypothetical protein